MEIDQFIIPPNVKPAWPMPYVTNIGIKPSEDLPTYAGFFRNQGPRGNDFFHGSWVMRFADKQYVASSI